MGSKTITGEVVYLVKWEGLGPDFSTWERRSDIAAGKCAQNFTFVAGFAPVCVGTHHDGALAPQPKVFPG